MGGGGGGGGRFTDRIQTIYNLNIYLCVLCEGAEDLFGHLEGLQKVLSAL